MEADLGNWRHLCIDMQRMFSEDTPWKVTWMDRVLPQVLELTAIYPERTIFTRFMPPDTAASATGMWRHYYEKWWMMTGDHLAPDMAELLPELAQFAPPAKVLRKMVYSPWLNGALDRELRSDGVSTLAISGGETDVCVMAAVLGAIDLGYKVVLLQDAVCSGADETHDASLKLMHHRFTVQMTLMTTEAFLREASGGGAD
jgi:nicotinamidase-related amidase